MNKHTQVIKDDIKDDMGALAQHARELFDATKDAVDETVVEARKRLAVALDVGREGYGHIREKAVEGVKAADRAARDHLYATIGVAFGAGTLFAGLMMHRR